MSKDSDVDAIPGDIAEFMNFFRKNLAELSFPDVDLSSLDSRAENVRERARALANLNEQVRAAREALDNARTELDAHARRGLAYVTVYARGDQQLTRGIEELALARTDESDKSKGKRKPRTRTRAKVDARAKTTNKPTAELPFSGDAAAKAAPEAA